MEKNEVKPRIFSSRSVVALATASMVVVLFLINATDLSPGFLGLGGVAIATFLVLLLVGVCDAPC